MDDDTLLLNSSFNKGSHQTSKERKHKKKQKTKRQKKRPERTVQLLSWHIDL